MEDGVSVRWLVDEVEEVDKVRSGGRVRGRRRLRISSEVCRTWSATLLCLLPSEETLIEISARSARTLDEEEPSILREIFSGVWKSERMMKTRRSADRCRSGRSPMAMLRISSFVLGFRF